MSRLSTDSGFRLAFRHYSTFFLIAATLMVPLHLFHSVAFADVVGLYELHSSIETLPEGSRVRGVSPEDLDRYRSSYWVLALAQLALLPLVMGAAEQASRDAARGRLPGVLRSWRTAIQGTLRLRPHRALASPSALIATVGAGIFVAVLIERIGMLVVGPLPRSSAWLVAGLVMGVARAAAIPFLIVTFLARGLPSEASIPKGDYPAEPTH